MPPQIIFNNFDIFTCTILWILNLKITNFFWIINIKSVFSKFHFQLTWKFDYEFRYWVRWTIFQHKTPISYFFHFIYLQTRLILMWLQLCFLYKQNKSIHIHFIKWESFLKLFKSCCDLATVLMVPGFRLALSRKLYKFHVKELHIPVSGDEPWCIQYSVHSTHNSQSANLNYEFQGQTFFFYLLIYLSLMIRLRLSLFLIKTKK